MFVCLFLLWAMCKGVSVKKNSFRKCAPASTLTWCIQSHSRWWFNCCRWTEAQASPHVYMSNTEKLHKLSDTPNHIWGEIKSTSTLSPLQSFAGRIKTEMLLNWLNLTGEKKVHICRTVRHDTLKYYGLQKLPNHKNKAQVIRTNDLCRYSL